ncbi:MAG: peptidoglycan DD-metalloendopeptidase family protein [Paludibacteraceae bacterium]|nr:peptidoglycan DD-metalloendopeptidase family protein [Paludibacteraceae bacterium]
MNYTLKRVVCMLPIACAAVMALGQEAGDNLFDVEELTMDDEDALAYMLQPAHTEEEPFDLLSGMHFCDSLPECRYNTVWDNFVVNPYDVNLHRMKDSVNIDMTGYCHPIAITHVTSKFGMRTYRYHYGIDLKLNIGDTIRSAFDGIVRISKVGYGYGNYVLIRHPNGLETVYGHCSKLLVAADSVVRAGQPIALGGNTGRSTGPHLHFEMRYVGNAIDPSSMVDFETGRPKSDSFLVCEQTFRYKGEIAAMAWYTVRKGDTLSGIAKKRHTTVAKLCKLNHITTKTVLSIGRRLRCS